MMRVDVPGGADRRGVRPGPPVLGVRVRLFGDRRRAWCSSRCRSGPSWPAGCSSPTSVDSGSEHDPARLRGVRCLVHLLRPRSRLVVAGVRDHGNRRSRHRVHLRGDAGLHRPGRPHVRDGQRHRLLPGAPQHRPVGGQCLRGRRTAGVHQPGATFPDVDGFRVALIISAGLGLLTAVLAFVLPGRHGPGPAPAPQRADHDPMEIRMEEEALLDGTGAMLSGELDLDPEERRA